MLRAENVRETCLALILILTGVVLRVMPHPDNFTPVTAIAFFAGVTLSPALALTVPLLVMVASDIFIGPHSLYWLTWTLFLLTSLIGIYIRKNPRVWRLFIGTLFSSFVFFVFSNLGVFLFDRMYPITLDGFVQCYTMALPFFRNSLLADLFYSSLLFGIFAFSRNRLPKTIQPVTHE